jgi:hypothetical protein
MNRPASSVFYFLASAALLLLQGCKDKTSSNSATAASGESCLAKSDAAITDSAVGLLRIGMPAKEVGQRCHVVRDTVTVNDDYVEVERALWVVVGMDTVRAWVPRDSITSIEVLSDGLSTQDSLRVGLTLAQLRGIKGLSAVSGEATTWINVPRHCGVGLVISGAPGMDRADVPATEKEIRSWPDSIRVTGIEVSGCRDSD